MKVTEEMYAAIPLLVAQGHSREDIASTYGVSVNCLQVLCSRRGISLRKAPPEQKRKRRRRSDVTIRIVINEPVMLSLQNAATQFGRANPSVLVADLLEKISTDHLFLAVLDEETA